MYNIFKRIFDIISAILAIMILIPLFIPVMILLKLTAEGDVFYFQKRIGYKNKPFMIYKFATMMRDSVNMKGGFVTQKNDPRVTKIGSFLRKSKINELPQLINILLGHMSVVGPRPIIKESFEAYPDKIQKVIYNEKPGLTGIGSIIFRDEEKLITEVRDNGEDVMKFYIQKIFPAKGKLEVWYQNNKSFILDLKIIFMTAWVIFKPESKLYTKIFKDLPKILF